MKIYANQIIGKIKELHGVNCAPYKIEGGATQRTINQVFSYIRPPYSRLHDCGGSYGGTYFVDITNIFRNFDADENDENNYDFYYTDEYISSIIRNGTQIVYRLGVTIEWGSKKYTCHPPKDFLKWAKICEHIIMHYNKGWANGFNYNIEYWEIWNEPENPPMWTGTKEQFLELYKVSSKYLKSKFPEIKIGGYGSCGFYAVFRPNQSDFIKGFLTWFDDFLKMCKTENCPLDFYTWHIYTSNINEIALSAKYVKEKLLEYGFDKTECQLNEWNYGSEGGGFDNMDTIVGAGFIASALISMQNNNYIDIAQYYCLSVDSRYNGMMNLRTDAFTPVMHVFWAFNKIYRAENQLKSESLMIEPSILASIDKNGKIYILLSNYQRCIGRANEFEIIGAENKVAKIYKLTDKCGFVFQREFALDSEHNLYTEPNGIYYVEI